MRTDRSLFLAVCRTALLAIASIAFLRTGPALASPAEEIYVLNTADASVDRYVPRTRTTTLGYFDAGENPNEIRIRGRTAYITSSSSDRLIRADLNTGTVIDEIALDEGANPWSVALTATRAYVSNWASATVSVVDLAAGATIDTIPVGVSPEGLLLAGDRLFVANSGYTTVAGYDSGSVSVIDLASATVIETIRTGLNPQALAHDATGRVHVVCTGDYVSIDGEIDVIDPVGLTVEAVIPLGGSPGTLAIDAHGVGYASSYVEGLLVYDAIRDLPLRDAANPVDVGGTGAAGLLPADGGGVWVSVWGASTLLLRIAPPERAFAIEETIAVGGSPISLARSAAFMPPPDPVLEKQEEGSQHAVMLRLSPSPAPGVVRARLVLAEPSPVALTLFDLAGRHVASIEERNAGQGETEVTWDLGAAGISTGRYLLLAKAGCNAASRAILFTR